MESHLVAALNASESRKFTISVKYLAISMK